MGAIVAPCERMMAGRFSNVVIAGAATACALAFLYLAFRGFSVPAGPAPTIRLIVTALLAVSLLAALRLNAAARIGLALALIAATVSLYTAEVTLALVGTESRGGAERVAAAAGRKFDSRSKKDVIRELRQRGIDAYSYIPASVLYERRLGDVRFRIDIDGSEVTPLSDVSGKTIVFCDETGQYSVFDSDEHGFHNPKGLWGSARIEVADPG